MDDTPRPGGAVPQLEIDAGGAAGPGRGTGDVDEERAPEVATAIAEVAPVSGVSALLARGRRRAGAVRTRADAVLERYRGRPVVDILLGLQRRDQEAAGGVVGSAVAFRLFLFFVPLLLFIVGLAGFLASLVTPQHVADAGITGSVAAQINSALQQPQSTRWVAILTGLVGMATTGRTLSRVLATASCLAWRMPVRSTASVRVVGGVVGLTSGVGLVSVVVNQVRNDLGLAVTGMSLVVALAAYAVGWLLLTMLLPRATADPAALIPGAVTIAAAMVGMQAVSQLYLPDRLTRASQVYGTLGATVVTLGWFFILGRVITLALSLNAAVYERLGSIADLVFSLPLIRALPRRFPALARYFQLDVDADPSPPAAGPGTSGGSTMTTDPSSEAAGLGLSGGPTASTDASPGDAGPGPSGGPTVTDDPSPVETVAGPPGGAAAPADTSPGDAGPGPSGGLPATDGPAPSRARGIAASVLGVLAVLALVVATFAVWAERTAFREERVTEIAARTLAEPAVQAGLAEYITRQVFAVVPVEDTLAEVLPDRLQRLGPVLTSGAEGVVDDAMARLLADPRVQRIVGEVITFTHRAAMSLLEGEGIVDGVTVTEGVVSLNLLPLVGRALDAVQDLGLLEQVAVPELTVAGDPEEQIAELSDALGRDLPDDFGQLVVYRSDRVAEAQASLQTAQRFFALSKRAVWLLVVVAVGLLVATIVVAPRRWRALLFLGLGTMVGMVVLRSTIRRVLDEAPALAPRPGGRQAIFTSLDTATATLTQALGVVLVVATIAVVVAMVRRREWRRDGVTVAAVVAGAAVVALLDVTLASVLLGLAVAAAVVVAARLLLHDRPTPPRSSPTATEAPAPA